MKSGRLAGWMLGALLFCASSAVAAPDTKQIQLPQGFTIEVFAEGLNGPRALAFAPNGDLLVTEIQASQVTVLSDRDRDGKADGKTIFAKDLNQPHGLAFYKNWLYVGETDKVVRYDYQPGKPASAKAQRIVNLPSGGGHYTRTVAFGPDNKMYVSIGSTCNVCKEADSRRATVMQYDPDGSAGKIYAAGLRNAVGLRFDQQGRLWATSNGRDRLGDDIPPDELHLVKENMNAGWPFCHAGKFKDDRYGQLGSCSKVDPPEWGFQAHSAALGLAQYTAEQFPAEYRGDLFVAFHGSWNRTAPTGYKLVRVHLDGAKPAKLTDFATGWLRPDGDVVGRPVDVVTGPDGSLYVSDDASGTIYKISYRTKTAQR